MRKYTNITEAITAINAWPINTGHTQIGYDPAEDRIVWEDNVGSTRAIWTDGIVSIGDYSGPVTREQLIADIEEVTAHGVD